MIDLKRANLEQIIFSTGGKHLSIYVEKKQSVKDMQKSLRKAIKDARSVLEPVMQRVELARFLRPLYRLAKNTGVMGAFRGNLAIYRKENSLRVISFSTQVEDLSIVSSSFHVKPLLQWIQSSRDFLMVAIGLGSVRLYRGDCQSMRFLGVRPLSDLLTFNAQTSGHEDKELADSIGLEVTSWVQERISQLFGYDKPPPIFIAGPRLLTSKLARNLQQRDIVPVNYGMDRYVENTSAVAQQIRELLKLSVERKSLNTIDTFALAHKNQMTETRLAKIAQAAASGRVRSLLIASDVRIYGKFDPVTGALKLNPFQMDHEDDDVFDDIAQSVLDHGGQVHVANRDAIPDANLAVAILHRRSFRAVLRTNHHDYRGLNVSKSDLAIGL